MLLNNHTTHLNLTQEMMIHDIRIFKGKILIADFINGLIVMDILFGDTFVVEAFKVYSVMTEINRISHIHVETKWPSDVVVLTRIKPPVVFEINLSDLCNPLYYASYNSGQDQQYSGTSYISFNEHFLVTIVYSD